MPCARATANGFQGREHPDLEGACVQVQHSYRWQDQNRDLTAEMADRLPGP